eukprot:TRINITY_DN4106_c0_g2_i1.p1 TRINITY_DN4106_c0_g2~~TRINITY_DN4106_c0_g2_i1.p1  ORF type:complete len:895 (-),score=242.95 TRINITY_DN4106_c0_g2_i1:69-2753(-)
MNTPAAAKSTLKTQALKVEPSVIHFDGFQTEKVSKQVLKITNVSQSTERLLIYDPQTPFFKVRCARKGTICPGIGETITVEFNPAEMRYYYDCIKIRATNQTLVVPIHAYPVVNEVNIPPRLDFGICPLGEEVTKKLNLKCSIPIEFDYSVEITKENEDFEITPLKGIVKPNQNNEISITYNPTKLSTQTAEISVTISQFHFVPRKCIISASAQAGLQAVKTLKQKAQLPISPVAPPRTSMKPKIPSRREVMKTTRLLKKGRKTTYSPTPTPRPPVPDDKEVFVESDGLAIPLSVKGPTAVAKVLLQKPGRQNLKEDKKAKRVSSKSRSPTDKKAKGNGTEKNGNKQQLVIPTGRRRSVVLSHAPGPSVHPEKAGLNPDYIEHHSGPSRAIPAQCTPVDGIRRRLLKEQELLGELRNLETSTREREFKMDRPFFGSKLLTSDEVKRIKAAREAKRQTEMKSRRQMHRARTSMKCTDSEDCSIHLYPDHVQKQPLEAFESRIADKREHRKFVRERLMKLFSTILVRNRAEKSLKRLRKLKQAHKGRRGSVTDAVTNLLTGDKTEKKKSIPVSKYPIGRTGDDLADSILDLISNIRIRPKGIHQRRSDTQLAPPQGQCEFDRPDVLPITCEFDEHKPIPVPIKPEYERMGHTKVLASAIPQVFYRNQTPKKIPAPPTDNMLPPSVPTVTKDENGLTLEDILSLRPSSHILAPSYPAKGSLASLDQQYSAPTRRPGHKSLASTVLSNVKKEPVSDLGIEPESKLARDPNMQSLFALRERSVFSDSYRAPREVSTFVSHLDKKATVLKAIESEMSGPLEDDIICDSDDEYENGDENEDKFEVKKPSVFSPDRFCPSWLPAALVQEQKNLANSRKKSESQGKSTEGILDGLTKRVEKCS